MLRNRQAQWQMRVNTATVSSGFCTIIDPGHPLLTS
jgi:hypothetical protein